MASFDIIMDGNYRGDLVVKSSEGRFYMAVSCYLFDEEVMWDWYEIPENLYSDLIEFKYNV